MKLLIEHARATENNSVSKKSLTKQYLPMDAMNRKTLDIEPSMNKARLLFFAELFGSF